MSFADVLLHGRTYHMLVHTYTLFLSLPLCTRFRKTRACSCTDTYRNVYARARVYVTYARRTTTTRRRRRRLRVCFHGYHRRGTRAVRLQPLFDDDVPEDREGLSRKELAAGELRVRKASISPRSAPTPPGSLLPYAFRCFSSLFILPLITSLPSSFLA